MRIRMLTLVAIATLVAAPSARAQQSPADSSPSDTGRATLQARVRQRIATVVKQRLALTDDQMRQLTAVNATYEGRRRALVTEERAARMAIRTELQRGNAGDQKQVETALADMFRTQRARIDLAEQEQRELSRFLQPSQRAGYLAIQEQVRRRVEQMRQERGFGATLPRRQRPNGGLQSPR